MSWVITAIHETKPVEALIPGEWFQINAELGGYAVQAAGNKMFRHQANYGSHESVVPFLMDRVSGPLRTDDLAQIVTLRWQP